MIVTTNILKKNLENYSNVYVKISNEIKNKNYIRLTRGLYETDKNTPAYYLAGAIYGPSYLSFDFALSYYGIIPEKVYTITSATFGKNKHKEYHNDFGTYTYRDVPKNVYYLGVKLVNEGKYPYQIATPEKAICDKLYTLSPMKNLQEMKYMIFEDLRIDLEEIKKLNIADINELEKKYHSTNVSLFVKMLKGVQNDK